MAGDSREASSFIWLPRLVNYRFDAEKKQAIRSETAIPKEGGPDKTEILMNGISSLQFEASVSSGEIPSSVAVSVGYGDGTQAHLLKKRILIPVSFRTHE